jgi:hypothetical protein
MGMGFLGAARDFIAKHRAGIKPKIAELLKTRRRAIQISAAACLGLLVITLIVITVSLTMNQRVEEDQRISDAFRSLEIPPEDLFLAGEPDFLPDVLLEREPRLFWTAGDVRPYWTDPLDGGAQPFLDTIEGVIDDLMERVP